MIEINDTLKEKWKRNERYIQVETILNFYRDRQEVGIFPNDTLLPSDTLYPLSSMQKEEVELTLYTIDIEELIDVTTSSIPTNKMTLKVDNESGIFEEFNPNSILEYLQNDATIDFYVYLDEDKNNKILISSMDFESVNTNDDLTATINCSSSFSNLQKIPFRDINNDVENIGHLTTENDTLINYLKNNYPEIKDFQVASVESNDVTSSSLNLKYGKYETLYEVLWNIIVSTKNGFWVNDRLNKVKLINRRGGIVETIPKTLQLEKAKLTKENEFNRIVINNAISEIRPSEEKSHFRYEYKGNFISDIQEKTITRHFKNLWNGSYEQTGIDAEGQYVILLNGKTAIIEVEPNTTYTIQKFANTGIGTRYIYGLSNTLINTDNNFEENNFGDLENEQNSITTNSDTNYLYLYVTNDTSNIPYLNVFKSNYFYENYVQNTIDIEIFIENGMTGLVTSDKNDLRTLTTSDFICTNCEIVDMIIAERYIYYTLVGNEEEDITITIDKMIPEFSITTIDKLVIGKKSDNFIEINSPSNILEPNYYNDITTIFPISLKVKTKIMGLPYLEIGDVVAIETDYGEKIVNITKLNYSYDGGLVCDIEGYSTDYDGLFPSDDLFPSDVVYPNMRKIV